MQREGSRVGAVVQQSLDSLLVFIGAFVFKVRTAGQDVEDLGRDPNKRTLSLPAPKTLFCGDRCGKAEKEVTADASLLSCCE